MESLTKSPIPSADSRSIASKSQESSSQGPTPRPSKTSSSFFGKMISSASRVASRVFNPSTKDNSALQSVSGIVDNVAKISNLGSQAVNTASTTLKNFELVQKSSSTDKPTSIETKSSHATDNQVIIEAQPRASFDSDEEANENFSWLREVPDAPGFNEHNTVQTVEDFLKQQQTQQTSKQASNPESASSASGVNQETPSEKLEAVNPWEGLTKSEQENIEQEISQGKLVSKLGQPQTDSDGVKSLPECYCYQLIDVPPKNAAAVFWDQNALHETAPNRIKTSDIKFLEKNKIEALYETTVQWPMRNDVSKVTTYVKPVAGDGYFFNWSLSPGEQPKAYSKASDGSLLLLPHNGKTLLVYKSISTLKDNTFYQLAAGRIEGTIQNTTKGIVKAITNGHQKSQKLAEQVSALEKACE